MKSFNKKSLILLLILGGLFSSSADAQCKRFTKKYCLPTLTPYTHNGKLISSTFFPGEKADLELTFNAGKSYRILVCSQDLIGQVKFIVMDKTRKILYKSKEGETNPYWDFKMATTQDLIIQVDIPAQEKSNQKNNIMPKGCVSIMIGFKN